MCINNVYRGYCAAHCGLLFYVDEDKNLCPIPCPNVETLRNIGQVTSKLCEWCFCKREFARLGTSDIPDGDLRAHMDEHYPMPPYTPESRPLWDDDVHGKGHTLIIGRPAIGPWGAITEDEKQQEEEERQEQWLPPILEIPPRSTLPQIHFMMRPTPGGSGKPQTASAKPQYQFTGPYQMPAQFQLPPGPLFGLPTQFQPTPRPQMPPSILFNPQIHLNPRCMPPPCVLAQPWHWRAQTQPQSQFQPQAPAQHQAQPQCSGPQCQTPQPNPYRVQPQPPCQGPMCPRPLQGPPGFPGWWSGRKVFW